jgi:SAM-dependent methyltransferase
MYHLENPLAGLYIESTLGAPLRQESLISTLHNSGYSVENKRCLDIGCSDGALLLACQKYDPLQLVGIDISEGRIQMGRELCKNTNIELFVLDILEDSFPTAYGPFDAIFSTDVLEHVASPAVFFRRIFGLLSHQHDSFVYITVYNKLNFNNIQKEPHYGVPGLILLPFQEAEEVWYSIRDKLQSNLDYEVFDWYTYPEYEQIALECHLKMSHFPDTNIVTVSPDIIRNYATFIGKFRKETLNQINEFPFLLPHKKRVINAVEQFCSECIAEHESILKDGIVEADLIYLYLKYYIHVFQMIVKHML